MSVPAAGRAEHEQALAGLRDALGGEPPPGVAALPAEELARLAADVRHARADQSRALHAATERGMQRVPWVLRGAVRRVVVLR
jgi:hypothetical protein